MGRSKLCDCQFRGRCSTYNDAVIDPRRKGPLGLGCTGQTDEYRGCHCKAFQCAYLTLAVTDGFRHLAAEEPSLAGVRASC